MFVISPDNWREVTSVTAFFLYRKTPTAINKKITSICWNTTPVLIPGFSFSVGSFLAYHTRKGLGCKGGGGTVAYLKADENVQGQGVCVCGGRLHRCGKSRRSEPPEDGYRSDSLGIVDQFPTQRSSGSVREALRLTRPPGVRNAEIFSHRCRCPPHTQTPCPWTLSGF